MMSSRILLFVLALTTLSFFFPQAFSAIEEVQSIQAIGPDPRANPNFIDRFGARIDLDGFDALLVDPGANTATHWSLNSRQRTNFFSAGSFSHSGTFAFSGNEIVRTRLVGNQTGTALSRYDRENGRLLSESDLTAAFPVSADVTGGLGETLVVLSAAGKFSDASEVIAFNRRTLEVEYRREPADPRFGFWWMLVEGDQFFTVSALGADDADCLLQAFDLLTGSELWAREVPCAVIYNPFAPRRSAFPLAAGFGRVIVGGEREFVIYDSSNGDELGRIATVGREVDRIDRNYPGGTYAGGAAIGNQRIYLQDPSMHGQDSPGIAVYDFQLNRLFGIANPYFEAGDMRPNDFGGEMAVSANRLLVGSKVIYDDGRDVAPPRVFDIEFTTPDNAPAPGNVRAFFTESSATVSENESLAVTVALDRASRYPIELVLQPDNFAGGTATPGGDFVADLKTIIFKPGEKERTVSFAMIDDTIPEDEEDFEILVTAVSGNITPPDPLSVTIRSDDFDFATEFVPLGNLAVSENAQAGSAVTDIAANDSFILVGMAESDEVLVFDTVEFAFLRKLTVPDDVSFGRSVDLDGAVAMIGAPESDGGEGRVSFYNLTNGSLLATFPAPNQEVTGEFGERVRIHGDFALAGVRTGEQVALYRRDPATGWALQQVFTPPRGLGASFGDSFDLNDELLILPEWAGPLNDLDDPDDPFFEAITYLHELPSGQLRQTIEGGNPLGRDVVVAGPDDFAMVEGADLSIFDQAGNNLVFEDLPNNEVARDGDYNGRLAVRSVFERARFRSFNRDSGVDTEVVIRPQLFFGRANLRAAGRVIRAGRRSHSKHSVLGPVIPAGNVIESGLALALNRDFLFTTISGENGNPAIFQLPFTPGVSVLPGIANEGDGEATVTFALSSSSAEAVEIRYATLPDSAEEELDFEPVLFDRTTIPAGSLSTSVSIPLIDNENYEEEERFQVLILSATRAGIADRVSSITIEDDETEQDLPLVSVVGDEVIEGEDDDTLILNQHAEVEIQLDQSSENPVWVDLSLEPVEASYGFDYGTPPSGVIPELSPEIAFFAFTRLIPAGETSTRLLIPIIDDEEEELPETFRVRILRAINGRLGPDPTAIVQITDDDGGAGLQELSGSAASGQLGSSVAAGGNLVIAGEPGENSAEIYQVASGNSSSISGGLERRQFGKSVATDGDLIVVGAPWAASFSGRATVYDPDGSEVAALTPQPSLSSLSSPQLGHAVALGRHEGITYALASAIGSRFEDEKYVIVFDASTGEEVRRFTYPDTFPFVSNFGEVLAVAGRQVLVGSNSGVAFLFDWTTGALVHTLQVPANEEGGDFGESVALDDERLFVGADNDSGAATSGQVFIFERSSGSFERRIAAPGNADLFGHALAVGGGLLYVGAPEEDYFDLSQGFSYQEAGALYRYEIETGQLIEKVISPAVEPFAQFGYALAVDGPTLAIGSRFHGSSTTGSVFISFQPTYSNQFEADLGAWISGLPEDEQSDAADGMLRLGSLLVEPGLAFALELDPENPPAKIAALTQAGSRLDNRLTFEFELPEVPRNSIEFVFQSTDDPGNSWNDLARKAGNGAWVSSVPVRSRSNLHGRQRVTFELAAQSAVEFFRLVVQPNEE